MIIDFNISQGDTIAIPDDLGLNLTINQSGDHPLLVDKVNKTRNKLIHIDHDALKASPHEIQSFI